MALIPDSQTTFEPLYLEHEGGTKFYEVITFNNPDIGFHVTVQRWGPIAQAKKGGAIKCVSAASTRSALASAEKTIKGKKNRNYHPTDAGFGLHGMARHFASRGDFTAALSSHYSHDQVTAILSAIGLPHSTVDTIIIDELAEAPPALPPKELDRGQTWGSW